MSSDDVLDLFGDGSYEPSNKPMPWQPGAKMDLDDYARCLLHVLPSGRKNAVDARELARALWLPWERTEYPLRNLVRRLILEKGFPIGTTVVGKSKGFFLIDSDTDAELYSQNLQSRADSILERREAVLEGWERRKRSKDGGADWPRRW